MKQKRPGSYWRVFYLPGSFTTSCALTAGVPSFFESMGTFRGRVGGTRIARSPLTTTRELRGGGAYQVVRALTCDVLYHQ